MINKGEIICMDMCCLHYAVVYSEHECAGADLEVIGSSFLMNIIIHFKVI